MEKAPKGLLLAATTSFAFKNLLRHYDKQVFEGLLSTSLTSVFKKKRSFFRIQAFQACVYFIDIYYLQ